MRRLRAAGTGSSSDLPAAGARAAGLRRAGGRWLLASLLIVALAVRLTGVTFGLPALHDPDEAFFMLTGMKLLAKHTLNPGWFGHPGQTTIYMLALVDLAVVALALASGRFASVEAFARSLYTDPTPLILPSRLMIVAFGVGCVALTYLIGRRLFDRRTGLVGAALLAINPLHVSLSQIIRTDVQSGFFLLLCLLSCVAVAQRGRLRDYLLAALWLGLACATKWPAAAVAAAIPGACYAFLRVHPGSARVQVRNLLAAGAAAPLALLAAGPFLLLDLATVRYNLGGEAKAAHLGSTGSGLPENLLWYVGHPLLSALGPVGLALAALGILVVITRRAAAGWTLGAAGFAFLLAISTSPQVWARWTVPILPVFAIFAAVGFGAVADRLRAGAAARIGLPLLGAAMALPIGMATAAQARERITDTRTIASDWAKAHIPPGSTVLVEHLAINLLREPWAIKYPAASLGCVDVRSLLSYGIGRDQVEVWRRGRAIVDIGTVSPEKLHLCRADYALFTDYDRYAGERRSFPGETATYERLVAGGALLLTVRPRPGAVGGPVVRVVRLGPSFAASGQVAGGAEP